MLNGKIPISGMLRITLMLNGNYRTGIALMLNGNNVHQ